LKRLLHRPCAKEESNGIDEEQVYITMILSAQLVCQKRGSG